jgi:hypothetical protein
MATVYGPETVFAEPPPFLPGLEEKGTAQKERSHGSAYLFFVYALLFAGVLYLIAVGERAAQLVEFAVFTSGRCVFWRDNHGLSHSC